MNLEELQVIWDSQEERTMYALDLDALHANIKRKGRGIERSVNAMELGMILIAGFVAVQLAWEPLVKGTKYYELFGAALMVGVVVYILAGRLRRRRRDTGFEPSVRGDLDRALHQVNYHIRRIRTFQWWFMLPGLLILVVSLLLGESSKPGWLWVLLFLGFVPAYLLPRAELRCSHLPKKRELETLRAKLVRDF